MSTLTIVTTRIVPTTLTTTVTTEVREACTLTIGEGKVVRLRRGEAFLMRDKGRSYEHAKRRAFLTVALSEGGLYHYDVGETGSCEHEGVTISDYDRIGVLRRPETCAHTRAEILMNTCLSGKQRIQVQISPNLSAHGQGWVQ